MILLDTNILVYTYDADEPERQQRSLDIVRHLQQSDLGSLSAQSLSEFCSVALNKLKLPVGEVMEQVQLWRDIFPVLNVTPAIVLEAARGVRDHKLAFYDAQIWACARLNQVGFIWSEDFQEGQVLDGVKFINPYSQGFTLTNWQ